MYILHWVKGCWSPVDDGWWPSDQGEISTTSSMVSGDSEGARGIGMPMTQARIMGIAKKQDGFNLQSWGYVDKQCSNQWSSPGLDYTQPRLWGYELCSSMFQQQSRSFKCSTTTKKHQRCKQTHLFTLFSKHVCILNESQWHHGNITSFFVGKQDQHVTFR